MAIAFNAATNVGPAFGLTQTVSHTASGADRFAVVTIGMFEDRVTGVTYGGVAMTRVGARVVNGTVGHTVYMLVGPATGAQNVVVTFAADTPSWMTARIVVASYTGVHQATAPVTAVPLEGYGTAPAVTLTTPAADSLLIHTVSFAANTAMTTADTARFEGESGNQRRLGVADRLVPAAGSATGTWSAGATANNWTAIGIALAPAAGTTPPAETADCTVRVGGALGPAVTRHRVGGVLVPAPA